MNQPTLTPTRKVGAAGLGGALATAVVWALGAFAGVDVPDEVAAGLASVVAFATGWWITERGA